MAEAKFKIGDRVRRNKHGVGTVEVVQPNYFFNSKTNYVVHWDPDSQWVLEGKHARDGINVEHALQLVTKGEEVKPYHRKTFKQLKDSVTVKKGALWQEACDDGDQEYVLLDSAFNRDPRQTQRIYDRSLVENDPKNFVEVFKVSPEYQTREELDLWEAFQKSQAKVRVTKPAAERVARKTKKAA